MRELYEPIDFFVVACMEQNVKAERVVQHAQRRSTICPTLGDGNCFFRAVAYATDPGETDAHTSCETRIMRRLQSLRERFVRHVLRRWDEVVVDDVRLSDLVEWEHQCRTKEEYARRLTRPGAWAGASEVWVFPSLYPNASLMIHERDRTECSGSGDLVCHIHYDDAVGHYSAMRPRRTRA